MHIFYALKADGTFFSLRDIDTEGGGQQEMEWFYVSGLTF